jgi:hypothetical protein
MMDHMRNFDDLSKPMQRELDERIVAAGGDVASVRREVEAALADINRQQDAPNPPSGLPADRALLMIELRYLDAKARTASPQATPRGGWFANLGETLRGMIGRGSAKNGS